MPNVNASMLGKSNDLVRKTDILYSLSRPLFSTSNKEGCVMLLNLKAAIVVFDRWFSEYLGLKLVLILCFKL